MCGINNVVLDQGSGNLALRPNTAAQVTLENLPTLSESPSVLL